MSDDALTSLVRDHSKGVLATIKGSDGRPQLSNIMYVVGDDDVISISVTDGRAKTSNLRSDPRASLHVTTDDFWSYAVVEGEAGLTPVAQSPDDETVDALVEYYRAGSGEHPDWDEYRRTMVEDRRLLIRLPMDNVYGMSNR